MKQNAAGILSILNNDQVGVFFLVELNFTTLYRYTTLPYDVTWNGNLYNTETNLLSFEAPRASTIVDRQPYKISLSGLDTGILAEVEAGIIHKPINIRGGFTINGVPSLGINDLLYVYSGTVANVSKQIADGTQSFSIEGSAPLSYLDAKSTLFTTRDGIRNILSTDSSFDQVYEGSSSYSLNWGKGDTAPTGSTSPIVRPWDIFQ